jgi:hypothetical protein
MNGFKRKAMTRAVELTVNVGDSELNHASTIEAKTIKLKFIDSDRQKVTDFNLFLTPSCVLEIK